MRIIYSTDNYKIIEEPDEITSLKDLKGDIFKSDAHPDFDFHAETLRLEERAFDRKVEEEGVFGYTLEKRCPKCDTFLSEDSCWGFVGTYDECESSDSHHYIVGEFKDRIQEEENMLAFENLPDVEKHARFARALERSGFGAHNR